MQWQQITKPTRGWVIAPNLQDYERVYATFSWEAARCELDGLPGGNGLNIDLDSFDVLTFVIGLHEALGVDIPEADYPKLATLESAIAYLETPLNGAARVG